MSSVKNPNTIHTIHGMAASIRASTESNTFDFSGMNASTIQTVVQDAFSEPLEWILDPDNDDEMTMIRITLVVGAGKQARQKYDAAAMKTVTNQLKSLQYEEDKGAGCTLESQGLYKVQHDTGKNLKTVVVFPKIKLKTIGTGHGEDHVAASFSSPSSSLLPKGSLELKVAVSTLNIFENMVSQNCPTWSQKKALLQLLEESILERISEFDQLLIQGKPLDAAQQEFYDAGRELTEKREHLRQQLQKHISDGNLTKSELAYLKQYNQERLATLSGEALQKAKERHSKLQSIVHPVDAPPLKHEAALKKMWKQLVPLQHVDEKDQHSNQLKSVQETQLLSQKLELLNEVNRLEQASRGWLEDDDGFESRRQACRQALQSQVGYRPKFAKNKSSNNKNSNNSKSSAATESKSKNLSSISSTTKVSVPVSRWATPSETFLSNKAKSKARLKKGDVFGAMMAADDDSSNDNEDNDDDDHDDTSGEPEEEGGLFKVQDKTTANDIHDSSSKQQTGNKKKKNKKKKSSGGGGDPSARRIAIQSPVGASKDDVGANSDHGRIMPLVLLQDYLWPCLLAVISWLVTALFGKPKTKKGKKDT